MRRLILSSIAITIFLASISACSVTETQPNTDSLSNEVDRIDIPETGASPVPMSSQTPSQAPEIYTKEVETDQSEAAMNPDGIEELIKSDLASRLNVSVIEITVNAKETRTWPDEGLGCAAQKGFYEPGPVAGYLITLAHKSVEYPYHTDLEGKFVLCLDPGKPVDPIR